MSTPRRPQSRAVSRRALLAMTSTGVAAALLPGAITSATAGEVAAARRGGGFRVFSPSFRENLAAKTVIFPRYIGSSHGQRVTYVITEASTRRAARRLGVNFAPRLANARGTAAVQLVRRTPAGIVFPTTVDFSPVRRVVAGPTGFPPAEAVPGAVGEPGYSPLVELPDGTVLNAPHLANPTGRADKVVDISAEANTVSYLRTDGFYEHRAVHYVSFEASTADTAALENATFAPSLDASPPDIDEDDDQAPPAREEIGIITNGQVGVNNPQRQGLTSAILDGLDPLNILGEVPENSSNSDYSPLWDAHVATWTPAAVSAGLNRRQTDFDDLERLARRGLITAPDGGPFRRSNFVINCPAISIAR